MGLTISTEQWHGTDHESYELTEAHEKSGTRLVLTSEFWEMNSTFCATLSVIGCITYLFCYIRVTSHMGHVKCVKESCRICVNESCRVRVNESCHVHVNESRHVRVNESCHVCLTPMCTWRRWKFSKVKHTTKFAVRKSYKADFWELITVARPSAWLGRRLWYRCGRKGVFSCHVWTVILHRSYVTNEWVRCLCALMLAKASIIASRMNELCHL